jgi:hypothetical protein
VIWVRVFDNAIEGGQSLIGDFYFDSVPRVGDGIVVDSDGKRRSMTVGRASHLGVSKIGDPTGTYLHCDLVWMNDLT